MWGYFLILKLLIFQKIKLLSSPCYLIYKKEIKHRDKKYFVGHIRAHSGLPSPLHEGNALTDTLTKVIALNLHEKIDKAKDCHKMHHQNAAGLRYEFHILARCVANLWERVCLYFSSGCRFADLDPGQIKRPGLWRAHLLARHPAASSHLHTLHPPRCTT